MEQDKVLSFELKKLREDEAARRAEDAEYRKMKVAQIIMQEVTNRKPGPHEMGVMIESERSEDGTIINHKAVLKPKVSDTN